MKCLNASMLKTAVFELVQQFYHATEFGNVANTLGLIGHSRQTTDNYFG